MASPEPVKPLNRGMRRLLYVAAVLVFLAGVQLFVFPERTERYFAWTIQPHLTAVFLGASYWSSVAFEVVAARQRRWTDARIAVPTVFVFTVLTLVVTLVHIENFHLGEEFEAATRAVTWTWIAIYSAVPVLMAVLIVVQRRRSGGEPPRAVSAPSPLVWLVGAQAVLLLVVGAALLIAPTDVEPVWPWELSALTGRAVGAWVFSLGVAAAHAVWERDPARLRPAAAAYVAFGVLQGIALLRYPQIDDWTSPGAIVYVAFLVSALVVGGATLALDRKARVSPPAP